MTDRFVWRRLWQAWLLCFLQAAPVSAAGSEREFSSISCGADYTLAVTTDGTPITWGFPLSERPKVYVPQGFLWQELFAGTSHSCGIINTGESLCWGRTREGQCDVPRGYSFVDLTLGEAFTCGLTANAELLCWGSSLDFELEVPPGNTWRQADAGTVHTCAVNTTGHMHCWGKQGYGRQAIPYQDNGDVTWEAVACGDRHCCGIAAQTSLQALSLRQEDNVICWGDDSELQLQVPGKDQGRSGVQETFSSISAGNFHTCGLTLGMDVWCWGRVNLYRLDFRTPSNATMLSSGGIHACILDINQKARCWGGDNVGQAAVPLDSATYPPSILDYSNDPLDINGEDPSMRIYEYVPGYSTPLRTKQHVNMAIFFPEFALADSATLTFTHVDGPADPYSPHVIQFPDSWNAPVINELNISAFDLSHWYDLRLGPSPAIRNITSTYVNGSTQHQLVDGGAYSVVLQYQDSFGHPPAIHWLQRYEVSYDLETLPPTLIEPVPGFTKQALRVSYTLQEDMFPESVWLTMTFIGAFPSFGHQVQDTNSPYEIQLSQDLTRQGTYAFDLNLGELNADLAGRRSPHVRRVLTASGIGGPGTRLVTGGRYNVTLRVADRYNNAPMFDQVSDIDFVWDIATEVTQVAEPTTVLNSPLVIEYTLTERALPGSLRFDIIWLRSLAPVPGMPSPKADPQSPHSFVVYPAKEQSSFDGISSNILRLSPSNLFRDISDEALPHPDIRSFESKGTPVYSYLQPLSEYLLSISYQDLFENSRSYLNRTLQTNFTVPFTPQAPALKSRTTSSLEVAWVRGFTGGMRITAYDLQLQMAPGPPTPWWNGTDAEAAADAASRATASIKDQVVLGQESSSTVFLGVLSSQHYLVRVRARNPIGSSPWSDWTLLRVLSACPDGAAHDGEACDDGNTVNGDGCSSSCQVELGWTCEAASPGDFADGAVQPAWTVCGSETRNVTTATTRRRSRSRSPLPHATTTGSSRRRSRSRSPRPHHATTTGTTRSMIIEDPLEFTDEFRGGGRCRAATSRSEGKGPLSRRKKCHSRGHLWTAAKATMVAETLGRRVATPSLHTREPPSNLCEASSLGLRLLEETARHLRPQPKRPLGQRIGGSENVLRIDAKSPSKWPSCKLLATSNNKENENDQVARKAHEASPREEGAALTEALRRSPLGHRLGALCKLRQALASTIQGPVEGVLRSGGAELLVSVFSSTDSTSACRVEAAWCLVQLSCGSSAQTKQVAQAGATQATMGALQSASIAESSELCDCCLQLLANVANDQDPSMRDHLLFDDIVEVLGQLFGEMPGFSWTELQRRDVLLSLTRLLVALCRGVSAPLLERVECSLEFFCQVLEGTLDREMLRLALQGLCHLLEAYQDSDARACAAALVSAGFNLKQAASTFQRGGEEALLLAKLLSLGFQA